MRSATGLGFRAGEGGVPRSSLTLANVPRSGSAWNSVNAFDGQALEIGCYSEGRPLIAAEWIAFALECHAQPCFRRLDQNNSQQATRSVCRRRTPGLYLQDHIWKPLGMTDTSFEVDGDKAARYAKALPTDPVTGLPQSSTARNLNAKFDCGGGCAATTASDYLRFALMLMNRGRYDTPVYAARFPNPLAELTKVA